MWGVSLRSRRLLNKFFSGIYNDSASDATRLANTITDNLIPSLSKAIDFYITFANGQEDPFAKGTSQDALTSMVAERFAQLKQGSDLTKAAETIFINFQNDSQGAINLVGSPRILLLYIPADVYIFAAYSPYKRTESTDCVQRSIAARSPGAI